MYGSTDDLSPCDLLNMVDKTLLCTTPPCDAYYSSIGYVLLGFIAQSLRGVPRWTDWDQLDVIPPERRHLYQEIAFSKLGTCESNPAIAHQFMGGTDQTTGHPIIFDLLHYSCLNGWSMGNVAASGHDLAQFFRDVFAPSTAARQQLVKPETAAAMQNFSKLTNPWCPGCYYGLGTFQENQYEGWARGDPEQAYMIGHTGQDWASGAALAGYIPYFNFAVSMMQNSKSGLNCKMDPSEAGKFIAAASCVVLDAVLRLYGHPGMDCDRVAPPGGDDDKTSCGKVAWRETMPMCSLCGYESKCLKCVKCANNFTGGCASCHHRHPWSADETKEAMAPAVDALPCLNACLQAGCPAGPPVVPALVPAPPGVAYSGSEFTWCANRDCSQFAEMPFFITAETQCSARSKGGGPDKLMFVGLATGSSPWLPPQACPAAATGGRCGVVCYSNTNAGCMVNLNGAVRTPSSILPAPIDNAGGCFWMPIGIKTLGDGDDATTFVFAYPSPPPPPPPPTPPPPQCLQLSGASCPDHHSYDGIFRLDGVFADGTPYYSRLDGTEMYLFWEVG
jgi:hypothetical protein